MKKIFISLVLSILILHVYADTGSFIVGGDIDKFYPVSITDGGWYNNAASEIELGRSNVHTDASWRGSMIAKLTYHVTNYGHGSSFIDGDIKYGGQSFIAGWTDATPSNGNNNIIVWLRGGSTTYYYKTNYTVGIAIYDGVQNALPYTATIGISYSYKTATDYYVNQPGLSYSGNVSFNGLGENYFAGGVAIGQYDTEGAKLAVNGNIHAKEVKVDLANWHFPDYVFEPDYQLKDLNSLENYINIKHHLPEVPSALEVKQKGLKLGEMNELLLKKIEELTLYLIKANKDKQDQQQQIDQLKEQLKQLIEEIHTKN